MEKKIFSKRNITLFFLILAIILILPLFVHGYLLRMLALIFMWIGLTACWNIIAGYTGYIDFGSVGYFGIGSYVTAILMTKAKMAFLPSLVFSGIISASFAIPIGIPTLRLRGAYFGIATLAFAEAMKQVVLELDRVAHINFFGGSHGITLPIGPGNEFFYYVMFTLMFMVMAVTLWIERSRFGYSLKAIHEAENTAELVGVNTLFAKTTAYTISAFFLGMFGATEAYWVTYITPNDVFNIHVTIQMVIMTLLGGMGTVMGPIVGGSFLTIISEILWARFIYTYMILLGIIILIVIIFMPKGIVGTIRGLVIKKKVT
ncbi:MAG: branched-chain amino acid ABC transporter permease [Deltaproteobacteria bacterium]|nr:branched-chain amino acid ABC transporter permease [Deltaproteobacteria bacterium]RLA90519.1 MAG: branched-chain amino acid ABC transporter permease [Deltaproteobacteria bacterium]